MRRYIINGVTYTHKERVQMLKKLAEATVDGIIKDDINLFTDEIDDFIRILKLELELMMK